MGPIDATAHVSFDDVTRVFRKDCRLHDPAHQKLCRLLTAVRLISLQVKFLLFLYALWSTDCLICMSNLEFPFKFTRRCGQALGIVEPVLLATQGLAFLTGFGRLDSSMIPSSVVPGLRYLS